jgi:cytosine/adenosine deaminase-related metal-dependent hydrolase
MATLGGAAVLGRDDIGALVPGMAADLIAYDLSRIELAGAGEDPLGALLLCAPRRVSLSVIGGRVVVEDGELRTADESRIAAEHNRLSRRLIEG